MPAGQPIILRHFSYEDLDGVDRRIMRQMHEVAIAMISATPQCAERTVGLRLLLQASDAFKRAARETK